MTKLFEHVDSNTFKAAPQRLDEEKMIGMGPEAIIDAVASKIISPEQAKALMKKYFKSPTYAKDQQRMSGGGTSSGGGCVY